VSIGHAQATPPAVQSGASALSGPGAAASSAVELTDVSKAYRTGRNELLALDGVSLSVAPGEFVCIIGASGCGKSTLLNLVAGLDKPTAGRVDTRGHRVALMFQEPALFPWLTAGRNVELGLRAKGVSRDERRARTTELLDARWPRTPTYC
jgi:NitT/TauT family transport system ATP-binding protein